MPENMPEKEKNISGGPPRLPFSLRLRTSKSSKATMARIGKAYAKGEIPEDVFKNMTWFMSQYICFLKLDESIDLDARITAIERALSKPKEVKSA
jgi:hypothetical protein